MTWRLKSETAGSGALGDIGAHIVDAVQFVTGSSLTAVSGALQTFVTERPLLGESVGLSRAATGGAGTATVERGTVTVDDAAVFFGTLASGGLATFEASRMAQGRKNGLRFEISGTTGAIAFDLERLNELQVYRASDGPNSGFRTILVTEPQHPYLAAWWPAGHIIGWEHAFTHQVRDLVTAIAAGESARPTFADGLQVQRVLDAVQRSSAAGAGWTPVD